NAAMPEPLLLVPGLTADPRFYEPVLAALWRHGPVAIADHTRDNSMAAIAQRALAAAPPGRFALAGHSVGGYVALEIVRQAPERVARLALLSTSARADATEQTERRRSMMAIAAAGRMEKIAELQFPSLVHPSRLKDEALRALATSMSVEAGA